MQNVTIFKNTYSTIEPFYISIEEIVKRIKIGKSKTLLDKIRVEKNKDVKDKLKKQLPAICFSGRFSQRGNNFLLKHSGYIAIDFDHLGDRLLDFKKQMINDKYTHLAFISPSGDGLKVIVKIPDSIKTHQLSCDALSDYYKEETLDDFKDVSRLCYESYDPDIYFNPDSDVFITLKEIKQIKQVKETVDVVSDFDEIIDLIISWLKKRNMFYQDGNKYKFLVQFSSACLRFGIPEMTACQKAIFRFIHTASPVKPKDYYDIFYRIYKNYSNVACTAHFNKKGIAIETITQVELTEAIFDISLPLKDVIYLDSVRDSMLQTFHSGRSRGETTYFKTIDEHWRWKRGHLVLMHGIMNHGKSALVIQFCLIKSIKDGSKWGVFSPEQDPPDDFYDDLVHAYIGKNTQPYFYGQMTEDEFIIGMNFIKEHFFYIFPDDEAPNQTYINLRFEELIIKHKIDGCIIDPYNQLDNDIRKFAGREDQYLSSFLTNQKRFAQRHNVFMIIISHPKGGLIKNNRGDYQCPDIFDLAGGAMWGNKCDDVLCTYRPFFSSERTNTTVKFISQKIKKRKLCGIPGEVLLDFDVMSGRYLEIVDGEKSTPFGNYSSKEVQIKNYYEKEEEIDFNNEEIAPF